ncbi:MAG: lipocalin-like domain-containing protein [Anaerolineae bacterium]|nr:hypothetical protein [Thermoflexales bacterium]MDW8408501.1 lipocalin-like domain-containing protein [Anaerolineae bacterium]
MTKAIRTAIGVLVILALSGLAWLAFQPTQRPQARARLEAPQARSDLSGFARALAPRSFTFPADHGPHPNYQTEWWYYTGNVQDQLGRAFGYQFTIFRRALTAEPITRASSLATNQLYFAHFALTDINGQQHVAGEKFSRGAGGLAGACARGSDTPCPDGISFHAFIEDWSVIALDEIGDVVRIRAAHENHQLDLTLRSIKPIVLHGDRGHSPKSSEPGNASFYYSFTRLQTEGQLRFDGTSFAVSGLSWMDHEWSTSALGANAVGWDWFSIQLDDQRELMLFQIRNADGTLEPASTATFVEANGQTIHLTGNDFRLEPQAHWRSPHSGGEYPVRWRIHIPSRQIDLTVEARAADQEMNVSIVYWEGAISVSGAIQGRPVRGHGYLEMTGYAESINGRF